MSDAENSDEEVGFQEENESDLELQEAFAKGMLKPGLNIPVITKKYANNEKGMESKLQEFKQDLDWIERLDVVSEPAPLAPEIAQKLQEAELQHQAKLENLKEMLARRRKKRRIKFFISEENPALDEFNRETEFYRQGQAAVLVSIPKLKELNVKTKRPDDYFAEMAKSDQHMHKVREFLMKRKQVEERREIVRQQRHMKKIGKQIQIEAQLKKAKEKKELLEELKKYRKGVRKDLDFLDDKKKKKPVAAQGKKKKFGDKKVSKKQKYKNERYGFGGKKKGSKRNTKDSFQDVGGKSKNRGGKSNKRGGHKQPRPGKNKRHIMKGRKRS